MAVDAGTADAMMAVLETAVTAVEIVIPQP
jgi:hypothetical protein